MCLGLFLKGRGLKSSSMYRWQHGLDLKSTITFYQSRSLCNYTFDHRICWSARMADRNRRCNGFPSLLGLEPGWNYAVGLMKRLKPHPQLHIYTETERVNGSPRKTRLLNARWRAEGLLKEKVSWWVACMRVIILISCDFRGVLCWNVWWVWSVHWEQTHGCRDTVHVLYRSLFVSTLSLSLGLIVSIPLTLNSGFSCRACSVQSLVSCVSKQHT